MQELNHESYDWSLHGNMINQPNNNCLGLCYTIGSGTGPLNPCIVIGISINPSISNPNPGVNCQVGWTFCWVAREIYGINNPKWINFREWMLNDAPSWFRNLYIKYGARFAKFISNKPYLKSIIKSWMDTKI